MVVVFNGVEILRTKKSFRILETSHPPTFYFPKTEFKAGCLEKSSSRSTFCEWKGVATYFDVVADGKTSSNSAWQYNKPTAKYKEIDGYISLYPSKMDKCTVDGEEVVPQPGDFYGGWQNSWIDGGEKGVKGSPGTEWW